MSDYKVDYGEVKALVTWEQALQYGTVTGIRRIGVNKLRGKCPFCKSDRVFSITENAGRDGRGLFNCFTCKRAGDVFEMLSLLRGNQRRDQSGILKAATDLQLAFGTVKNSTEAARTVPNSTPSPSNDTALLRIAETLQPDHVSLEPFGLSQETFRHFGAGWKPNGLFRGQLAVPIHDFEGNLKAYCGHSLAADGRQTEFMKSFPVREFIFNAHRVEAGEVRVLGDIMSVIQAFEGGETNAVAFLTETVDRDQTERLAALLDLKGCVWIP